MKENRLSIFSSALTLFCLLVLTDYALPQRSWCGGHDETTGSGSSLTPLPGNPLRKAVLDALRYEVKCMHGLDVVFVVRHLRVKEGWAWAHVQPQSQDGTKRYEDLSALLKIQDGAWKVAEIPCTEDDNPECLSGPDYFVGLQNRFPGMPAEILPDWSGVEKD